jgi:hypothetical protein
MAWEHNQKGLVHIYAGAARLAEPDYRNILRSATGATSAASRQLSQHDFDEAIARLEAVLDYRVQEGIVPFPANRKISDLHYWRDRLPRSGMVNSRLAFKIRAWWERLLPYLPESDRNDRYLIGIASHACASRVSSITDLRSSQAGLLIEALKDRYRHALRRLGDDPSDLSDLTDPPDPTPQKVLQEGAGTPLLPEGGSRLHSPLSVPAGIYSDEEVPF